MDTNGLREVLEAIKTGLNTDFTQYRTRWMEIQEFIMPRRGNFLRKSRSKPAAFTSIIDNTGSLALRTLQSGMMAGITSPARPWFRLSLADKQLSEHRKVKQWLHEVRDIMLHTFSSSNVYNAFHVLYGEIGGFGTAGIFPVFDFEDMIRVNNLSIGSYKIGISNRGTADVLVREFPMTAKQLVGEFGKTNVSSGVLKAFDNGDYNYPFTVLHFILPNDRRETNMMDAKNKAYSSIYYEEGDKEDKYLRVSGYDAFPAMIPRWEIKAEEPYGSGPGDVSLGDIKQLQIQQKRKAQGIDKMVNPPLQAPSSAKKTPINAIPGGVSYYDEGALNGAAITPLYEVNLRLGDLREDIYDTQQRIKRAFYEDLFLMLAQSDRRQITAREIEEKHEEKLLMLGPVLERLHDELLDPFIDRSFQIMQEKEAFPPPPPELEQQEIEVEYISLLAQAQQAVGTGAIERTFGFIGNMVGVYPEVRHKLNPIEALDSYANMMGVPPELIRTNDEVQALIEQEQQQAQQQQAMEMASQAAAGAKTLSEAKISDDESLLNRIAGGV